MSTANLAGMRLLLVEDQMLVAMEVESFLKDIGCEVIGIAGTLEQAMRLSRELAFDATIVDVNLDGEMAWPAVDVLLERNIPFVLASGYGSSAFPQAYRDMTQLEKPVGRNELQRALVEIHAKSRRNIGGVA